MKISFISPLDESSLYPSVLYLKEMLSRLGSHQVYVFSDLFSAPGSNSEWSSEIGEVYHFTRLPELDEAVGGFDCSVALFEDEPQFLPTMFGINSLPGILVAFDGVGERLFLSQPWQFRDPKLASLNEQIFETPSLVAFTSVHAMNGVSRRGRTLTTALPVSLPSKSAAGSESGRVLGYAARYPREEWAEVIFDSAVSLGLRIKWVVPERSVQAAAGFAALYGERRGLKDVCAVVGVRDFTGEIQELSECDLFFYGKHDLRRSPPTALFQALALGIPSVVLDFGPAAEIPDWAVVKVPVTRGVGKGVTIALKALLENQALRQHFSVKSRSYIELMHYPEAVLADLEGMFTFCQQEITSRLISRRIEILRQTEKLLAGAGESAVTSELKCSNAYNLQKGLESCG